MSRALELTGSALRLPPVPWRDPHTVSAAKLSEYIQTLEQRCLEAPHSADLRTCLGMAYAMNYEVYKSMDTLEAAVALGVSLVRRIPRTGRPGHRR